MDEGFIFFLLIIGGIFLLFLLPSNNNEVSDNLTINETEYYKEPTLSKENIEVSKFDACMNLCNEEFLREDYKLTCIDSCMGR